MAVFSVSTMEELIELSGIASGDVITLADHIDAVEQGYTEPVTLSAQYQVDLNGHTLSNVYLSGVGIFGKTVSNGNLINVYIDGSPTLKLTRVTGSFYVTGDVGLSLMRSAVDVTCSPLHESSGLSAGTGACVLSNAVVRNANFVGVTNNHFRVGTTHNFAGIVFDGCTFKAKTKSDIVFSFGGTHCYFAMQDCTIDSSVTSMTMSGSGNPLALVCAPLTELPSGFTIVTQQQLMNKAYLERIGFLP